MSIREDFKYGVFEDLKASAIELPFKQSDISMVIILPDSRTGLSALEEKLDKINFDSYIFADMELQDVTMLKFQNSK